MNEPKLKKLFELARKEVPSPPPGDFDFRVMQAVRREPAPPTVTLFDQLNLLFPKLVWASLAIIALCVAGELLAGLEQMPSVTDGVAQLSGEWLLAGNGL